MKTRQAKVSVETMKEVQNDKTLRTKGDKDRRLREKKQNNTKKFLDERKIAQIKQMKETEKLKARHEKEAEALNKDIQSVSLNYFQLHTRMYQWEDNEGCHGVTNSRDFLFFFWICTVVICIAL